MTNKIKQKFNIVLIFAITFIVLYFALKDDFATIINQIITIDVKYLGLSIVLIFSYYFLRSIVFNNLITQFKKNHKFSTTFLITLKTQFFNGVTPFSSGGQPFQIYMLKKEGIRITNATNIIIENFIVYQIALVLLGLIAVITNHYFKLFEVPVLKSLVTLGFIINILVTLGLFVLAFTVKLNKIIGNIIIKVFKKLLKNPNETLSKWDEYVENFHDGAIMLLTNKKMFVKGVLYNFVALSALYLIPLVLLYGMGNFNSISTYETIVTSSYVMLIGSFVPIPGGSGGLEYGFISFYGNYIKGATLNSIMLLWRFITYYLGVILGAIVLNFKKEK